MIKIISIIIIIGGLAVAAKIIFLDETAKNKPDKTIATQNSEIRDGVQYITITAKSGYSPKSSTAKAGIPTKLVIKTNNTYDCSASLVIKSLNYHKILPKTGEEIVDIGTPIAEVPLRGTCSMGMYSFLINFN